LKPAVLVIDVIHDFVYGKFGSERAASILPSLERLLGYARGSGVPVVYLVRPVEGDSRILKRRYSCFYGTGLDALLRELGVDTVVLTGLVTDICVQHTAADAFFRGYKVLIPRDCVEAVSDEAQEGSLGYMERMYGAKITTSEELMEGRLLGGGR
jgi:nicotinamidase-related amidase